MRLLLVLLLCASALAQVAHEDYPPSTVLIRGEQWALEMNDHQADPHMGLFGGWTYCDRRVISIDAEMFKLGETASRERHRIVVHEMLHANTCMKGQVWNLLYNSSDPEGHDGFDTITHFTVNLVRDNPELVKWLQEK